VPCRSPWHRGPRHSGPGLRSGMRTESPSPRQPVLAGSASRHVIQLGEQHRDDSGVLAHMEMPAELRDTTR
jgi:hypothetical protein